MGLFSFLRNNTLKSIEWLDNTKDTIVYRFPMDGRSIMFGSKLTVRAGQVAIFVNKGKVCDVFQEGIHTLSTSNLPILTQVLALPFGFKSPFFSEVYFVNTKQFTNEKWGTSNPVTMRDPEFGTIRIRAFGTYAFRAEDPVTLLRELFGTSASFETGDISEYLKSVIVSGLSDAIAESHISALDMSSNLNEFNETIAARIRDKFHTLGLKLVNLVIENISFPEEVEKAIDARTSLGVIGKDMDTFVKYKSATAMSDAANNPNGAAGTGIGLGAGVVMANMMKDSAKSKPSVKYCPKCGAESKSSSKFCSQCGHKF